VLGSYNSAERKRVKFEKRFNSVEERCKSTGNKNERNFKKMIKPIK
jgi:hypothetical protein